MLPEHLHWKLLGTVDGKVPRSSFISDQLFRITQTNCLNDPFEMQPRVLLEKYSPEDWQEAKKEAQAANFFTDTEPSDEEIELFFLAPFPKGRFDEAKFPGLWPAKIPELRPEPFHTISELDEFRTRKIREDVQAILNRTFGVLSLTRDPRNLLMWAHYGSEHRGIAVGFDCTHPFFLDAGTLAEVEYLPDRVAISSNGGIIRIAGKQLGSGTLPSMQTLLRKHPDWRKENELRFIVPLSAADKTLTLDEQVEKIYLKKIPHDAIKAIILGARVIEQHQNDIVAKLVNEPNMSHVRLFKAILSDSEFSLEFVAINFV